jgi:hypothetical protein
LHDRQCEPSLKDAKPELRYQFERLAYFTLDKDTAPGKLVLNRTLIWFQIPEGKKQLLKMLFGGKEKQFEDCIANHIKLMGGFIPVLDKLLIK